MYISLVVYRPYQDKTVLHTMYDCICTSSEIHFVYIYPTYHGNRGGIKVILHPLWQKQYLVFLYKTRENISFHV